ncbi:hypothetical protein G5S35_31375 [Paraburkholderia tropica]|uniref:hypothetical protein n=1 Tax=Paraburkholderia tropica TaxID=92647 RepID=UPI00160076A2|nr:hypothetical protein [Paraburkholderia tropica]QNB16155.1 hypothetical protein G5S35_31375 [Paraburkholderia tropica]
MADAFEPGRGEIEHVANGAQNRRKPILPFLVFVLFSLSSAKSHVQGSLLLRKKAIARRKKDDPSTQKNEPLVGGYGQHLAGRSLCARKSANQLKT